MQIMVKSKLRTTGPFISDGPQNGYGSALFTVKGVVDGYADGEGGTVPITSGRKVYRLNDVV